MITIKLKKWVPINGLTHLSTTWEIATDQAFTNVLETASSSTVLDFYQSNITVPTVDTYYARAMRHFANPADDYWSDVMPINNIDQEYSNMLLSRDITIEKPLVYCDINQLNSTNPDVVLRTSKFRSKQDGHASTHWIIQDEHGIVLYSKLYDTVNKEQITIPNLPLYRSKSKLFIKAIHVSGAGTESPVGVKEIVLHNFNFNISLPSPIFPRTELIVGINTINTNFQKRIKQIKVFDTDYKEIMVLPINYEINEFSIPWNYVIEDTNLYIEIYAYDNNGKLNTYKTTIKVNTDSVVLDEVVDHVYSKTVSASVVYPTPYFSNGMTSLELENKDVLITLMNSNKIHIFHDVNGTLTDSTNILSGVSLLQTNAENTLIKQLDGNKLLIDTLDANNHPVFMLYSLNINTGVYTLLTTNTRSDETTAMGYTNAMVQISNSEFVYIPFGKSELRTFNINTNTVTTLVAIPFDVSANSALIRLNNGKLMIIGGSGFITKVYDLDSGLFVDGSTLSPGNFVGANLKTVKLINNDVLVFRTLYATSDNGKTDHHVAYFDQAQNGFVDVSFRFEKDKYARSTIMMRNGEVFLSKYTPQRTVGVDLVPEDMLVQNFK